MSTMDPQISEQSPVDQADQWLQGLTDLQKSARILLYLPEDFLDLYKAPLEERLKRLGLEVTIAKLGGISDKPESYDATLSYDCLLGEETTDANEEANLIEKERLQNLFKVEGPFGEEEMSPLEKADHQFTDLEHRYFQVKRLVETQEQNEHFLQLASDQKKVVQKFSLLSSYQVSREDALKQMGTYDNTYFSVLGYFLKEAIDRVLRVISLGSIMKKYVKILLVDDLGERATFQLSERGYRKRYLSIMDQQRLNKMFSDFKQKYLEKVPDAEVSYQDFYTKCSIFEDYEIVVYNPWKAMDKELPIQFRLKKMPQLSRKEMRKKEEDPQVTAMKLEKLTAKQQKLESELNAVEEKLSQSEKQRNLSESAYVALNKKRKRALKGLKAINAEIDETVKEIAYKTEIKFYIRDLLSVFKDKKLLKRINKNHNPSKDEAPLDLNDILDLEKLVTQKKHFDRMIRKTNNQIRSMLNNMSSYFARNMANDKVTFQELLGVHTLNNLEMNILGAAIARVNQLTHIHQGAYFSVTTGNETLDWIDDEVSSISIYLANKSASLELNHLTAYFRVSPGDLNTRVVNSPMLPSLEDFNDNKYGLFIICAELFPLVEIINRFKVRLKSKRPFVPILLYRPTDNPQNKTDQISLGLLNGLKKEKDGSLNPEPLPYQFSSFEDREILTDILSRVMGIDKSTVQMAPVSIKDDSDLSAPASGTPEEEPTDPLQMDPGEQLSSLRSDVTRVEVSPDFEQQEQIYTLGSLFSFDDTTDTGRSDESATLDPSQEPIAEPPRDPSREPAVSESHEEESEPKESEIEEDRPSSSDPIEDSDELEDDDDKSRFMF